MKNACAAFLVLLALAAGLVLFLWIAPCTTAQELRPQPIVHPPHPSVKDFYASLRITEIEVLNYEPVDQILSWKFEEGDLIEIGEFQLTKDTHVIGELKKGAKRMVIYCAGLHGTGLNDRRKYLLQIEK